MSPTLHPYLKRGLDFDASPIDPSDLVEDPPGEHHDAQHQSAKRRRVEAIALQYLRGRPPVILTARLKGPFTKEWKNPWAKDVKATPDGQSTGANEQAEGQGERVPKASQMASPEASRAVGYTEEQLYSQPEPLPATAPLPDEDDLSGATDLQLALPKEPLGGRPLPIPPASPTGFMYRRVGQSKGEGSSGPKAKPRAINFSPSPTLKKKDNGPPGVDTEVPAAIVETEVSEQVVPHVSAEAVDRSVIEENNDGTAEGPEEEQNMHEHQESHKSRQSQYSTQAAMLLAQLEFQDDSSQSSTSSVTPRPWSQPGQNTPPPPLLQPSPAITPLSVFNPRMEGSFGYLAGDSVLCGPPVSTQDLFNAASPFAFSTVKKKSQRPRRTSLRFALTSKSSESMTAKSPTPSAERVPLKEKNTSTMWSFTNEKSSLSSSKLASQSPKRTTNDVELPQLDLHTSLDFGPNADFTDCFLRGLNNEP
ncbi:hypothetical protein BU25DRAFT_331491 [Macroventuria anomochaeta]|uniref:Uncharacterized protein n=1 Tax=Macroventuria anomochaeta TaxID=301207 RepID=A0ACB6SF72_9PLEO|nr:uncharacterized protein BU25DRAFT_331491 [Macroventuria anomochaeta]KAF2631964.1 hypothetical protein BU25DRAFT_331491 [Macroventuria anomochaeta]